MKYKLFGTRLIDIKILNRLVDGKKEKLSFEIEDCSAIYVYNKNIQLTNF